MARIAGTGPKPRTLRSRIRVPKFEFSFEPMALLAVLTPVVMSAPDQFTRAVAVMVVIGAAWIIGRATGRADLARELLDDEVKRVRRDDPAA